jgi:hypothetical protein
MALPNDWMKRAGVKERICRLQRRVAKVKTAQTTPSCLSNPFRSKYTSSERILSPPGEIWKLRPNFAGLDNLYRQVGKGRPHSFNEGGKILSADPLRRSIRTAVCAAFNECSYNRVSVSSVPRIMVALGYVFC